MKFTALLLAAFLGLAPGVAAHAESLDQALADAYLNNPQLQAARAGQSAAQSDVRAAQGGWYPKLTLSGGIARNNTTGNIDFGPTFQQQFGANLDQSTVDLRLDQPIYQGGTLSANVAAAENSASATHAATRARESTVLLAAVRAYLDVVEAQQFLQVQRDNVTVLQNQLTAARAALAHGEGTRTDVAQAQSRLEGAIAARIRADAALAQARSEYQTVIGHEPGALMMPAGVPELPTSLEQARQLATQTYDVVAARFAAQAASNNADAVAGTLRPSVGIFAELLRQNDPQYGFTEVTNRVIGLDITVPIWEGGTRRALTEAARQRADEATLQAQSAEETARNRAVAAWQDYLAANSSLPSFRAQLEAARIAFEGVKDEHRQGERTLLDVLNAEQEVRNSRLDLVRARRDVIVAGYALLAATGRLSAAALKLPLASAARHKP